MPLVEGYTIFGGAFKSYDEDKYGNPYYVRFTVQVQNHGKYLEDYLVLYGLNATKKVANQPVQPVTSATTVANRLTTRKNLAEALKEVNDNIKFRESLSTDILKNIGANKHNSKHYGLLYNFIKNVLRLLYSSKQRTLFQV